jgi:hypothetical protein
MSAEDTESRAFLIHIQVKANHINEAHFSTTTRHSSSPASIGRPLSMCDVDVDIRTLLSAWGAACPLSTAMHLSISFERTVFRNLHRITNDMTDYLVNLFRAVFVHS